MNFLEEREEDMRTYAFGWDFGNTETDAVMIVRGKEVPFHDSNRVCAVRRYNDDAEPCLTGE